MAKGQVLLVQDGAIYATAEKVLGGRRWLTETDQSRALLALRRRMGKTDPADDAEKALWSATGDEKAASWGALAKRLERARRPGSRTREGTNALAAALLGKAVDEITTDSPPTARGPGARSSNTEDDDLFQISYPKRIADHRAVILGQLASHLYPALFIRPRGAHEFWYPQRGTQEKHNPLRIGMAFACFAHFGNPKLSGQVDKPASNYQVRVYALKKDWPHGTKRVHEKELDKKIEAARSLGHIEVQVERSSPVESVSITDHNVLDRVVQQIERIRCQAPVEISWTGQSDAWLEIRRGQGDDVVEDQLVSSPVALMLEGCEKPIQRGEGLTLPEPGLYRVRLYPLRYSFVDPPYEWWLDVGLGKTDHVGGNTPARDTISTAIAGERPAPLVDAHSSTDVVIVRAHGRKHIGP